MKKTKKTWGILGTSMGSMLIIVALLTMVGIGSSDTYAASTCKCERGDLNTATKTCSYYEDVEQEKVEYCPGGSNGAYDCDSDTISEAVCKCKTKVTVSVPRVAAAECSGEDADSSKSCIPGEYNTGGGTCGVCPSGSYCPGDGSIHACPEGATCDGTSYECPPNTHVNGNKCVADATDADDDRYTCKLNEYRSGNKCTACPNNASCDGGTSFTCNDGYKQSGNTCIPEDPPEDPTDDEKPTCSPVGSECDIRTGKKGICTLVSGRALCQATTTGDDDNPSGPNTPTGGDDKPSNPTTPSGGGDDGSGGNGGGNNGGGNSGGNTGGNGNSGNTGGNNGNNTGGNNVNRNPSTATKTPLMIAIIGIISVGISSVVYFNGKKEINTEI